MKAIIYIQRTKKNEFQLKLFFKSTHKKLQINKTSHNKNNLKNEYILNSIHKLLYMCWYEN